MSDEYMASNVNLRVVDILTGERHEHTQNIGIAPLEACSMNLLLQYNYRPTTTTTRES